MEFSDSCCVLDVEVLEPPISGSLWSGVFHYTNAFSVVLLALVDTGYNSTVLDVGSYGKNSDADISIICGKHFSNF